MVPEFLAALVAKLAKMAEIGLLASYGAAANYVYAMLKDEAQQFSLFRFLSLLFLAAFLGNFLGGFSPRDSEFRDELLMGCGFCTFPLLAVVEAKFVGFFVRYTGNKLE